MLGFSLWKWLLTISWIMSVYIVCVKKIGKHFSFLPNREFRGYLTRWPFLQVLTKWQVGMTLQLLVMCFTRGLFVGSFTHKLLVRFSQSCIDLHCMLDYSPISHTHPLQLKPHKYRETIDWITTKFGMKLKLTKASWKSQLYRSD